MYYVVYSMMKLKPEKETGFKLKYLNALIFDFCTSHFFFLDYIFTIPMLFSENVRMSMKFLQNYLQESFPPNT